MVNALRELAGFCEIGPSCLVPQKIGIGRVGTGARDGRVQATLIREIAAARIPMWRRAITSGTVLIPTAWAPSVRTMAISAGVSYVGPSMDA